MSPRLARVEAKMFTTQSGACRFWGMNRQGAEDAEREPPADLNTLTRQVIGAALEVHRILGPGFLESLYEEALCVELRSLGVPFARQVSICVRYKAHDVGETRLDLLVDGVLVVELKAVDCLAPIHTAQVLSYLKAIDLSLGLLINFNVPALRHGIRRVIRSI